MQLPSLILQLPFDSLKYHLKSNLGEKKYKIVLIFEVLPSKLPPNTPRLTSLLHIALIIILFNHILIFMQNRYEMNDLAGWFRKNVTS